MTRASFVAALVFASAVPLSAQTSLSGFVRDSAGRPISNAQVSIDVLSRVATADDDGHYVLSDLTPGLRLVRVRRVGYNATSRMVQIVEGESRQADFVIARLVLLDSVVVMAAGVRQQIVSEINERRKMGFGHFKDSTDLAKATGILSVFQDMPSVTLQTKGGRPRIYLPDRVTTDANGFPQKVPCLANLWIDGRKMLSGTDPDQDELMYVRPNEIAVVEVYPRMSSTPAQYITRGVDLSTCGTVIIWTKRIVP